MKRIFITLIITIASYRSYAQNTFPTPSGNVGIGTATPTQPLQVNGNILVSGNGILGFNGDILHYYIKGISNGLQYTPYSAGNFTFSSGDGNWAFTNGKVGIGTSNPAALLHVVGTTQTNLLALVEGTNAIGYFGRGGSITGGYAQTPDVLALTYFSRDLAIGGWGKTTNTWSGVSLYINSDNGYVGIGTTSPDQKLTVNGTIHAKSVVVDTNIPVPDYVFKNGYNLPSLAEIKTYTDKNHHLPGVPAAAELEKNGINLGEMNMTLLKKVEELTLYLIEKDKTEKKQNEINEKQLAALKLQQKQINELKKSLDNLNHKKSK
jgi:hypothetical protein